MNPSRPDGCLGCDRKRVIAWLWRAGIDPKRFTPISPTDKRGIVCERCGQGWAVEPRNAAKVATDFVRAIDRAITTMMRHLSSAETEEIIATIECESAAYDRVELLGMLMMCADEPDGAKATRELLRAIRLAKVSIAQAKKAGLA